MAGNVFVKVLTRGNIERAVEKVLEKIFKRTAAEDTMDYAWGPHILESARKVAQHSTMGEAFQDSVGVVVLRTRGGKHYRVAWDVILEPISKEEAAQLLEEIDATGDDDAAE